MHLFSTALSHFSNSFKDASGSKAYSDSNATSVTGDAEGGVPATDAHVKGGNATIVENSSDRAVVVKVKVT